MTVTFVTVCVHVCPYAWLLTHKYMPKTGNHALIYSQEKG